MLVPPYVLAWLVAGAEVTIKMTLMSAGLGFPLGIVAGIARLSRWRLVRLVTGVYVQIFRGTSLLMQLFYFYFVFPFLGLKFDATVIGVVALGLCLGAYASEVVRGAILSVDPGQRDAAIALNMKSWTAMRWVILPQAFVAMLPPFGNQVIEQLKATSLLSLITISELAFAGKKLLQTYGQLSSIYFLVLVMYFVMNMPLSLFSRWLERRLSKGLHLGRVE
jgi:polar amino acid transport system permease protein